MADAPKAKGEFKEVKITKEKATPEQIERGLALLSRQETHKAKVKAGLVKGGAGTPWAELSQAEKDKRLNYSKRLRIRQQLIIKKAIAAGITVSDKEVDAAMKE